MWRSFNSRRCNITDSFSANLLNICSRSNLICSCSNLLLTRRYLNDYMIAIENHFVVTPYIILLLI